MKKWKVNALVDCGALVSFVISLVSGLVLLIALPGGQGLGPGNSARIFLGISRAQWENIHNLWSLVFSGLVIIHLALHWRFCLGIARSWKDRKGRGGQGT
jgi:hypothetical protein